MCKTISTAGMSREEWLMLRKRGIGGSDAGAICGLNPCSSPLNIYQDKISEELSEYDNEAMRQGRDLEQYVAERFCEATGLKVRRSNKMYWNDEHPFMFADVDRLIVGEDAGLECKTANAYNADKWKADEIPLHYMIQCYHYMAVTGKRSWYIAVVILGVGFKYARLEWDEDIIQDLIQIETNFWSNHVVARVIPDPDGSEEYDEVLEKYFHVSRNGSETPLHVFDNKLERRMELQNLIKKLETEQRQIDQEIKLYMGEMEKGYTDHYRVSWSQVDTVRLDSKKLKEEQPEIYKAFSNTSSSRRFTVKQINAA